MQLYYQQKCQGVTRIGDPLPPPPWHDAVPNTEPAYLPVIAHFTRAEVETVLRDLPNNKSSGMDGVTYESLKATEPDILTSIFNTCLENKSA